MHTLYRKPLRTAIVVGFSGVVLAACGRPFTTNSVERLNSGQRCGIENFPGIPSDHIVVELEKPFRVRAVEGAIKSKAGDWPENTFVTLQFRARDGSGSTVITKTDGHGSFRMPELGTGEYCFKASVAGWQSLTGLVIVSATANPNHRIILEMLLGV